jgi:hypothetical protein
MATNLEFLDAGQGWFINLALIRVVSILDNTAQVTYSDGDIATYMQPHIVTALENWMAKNAYQVSEAFITEVSPDFYNPRGMTVTRGHDS